MSRAEQTKTERRRRSTGALGGRRQRLSVDESKLDRANYVYRFANDDSRGRIEALIVHDDWEVVSDRDGTLKANTAGDGSQVSVVAGVGEQGAPLKSVLLRKPKHLNDEDYAARQRLIDEREKGLRSGNAEGEAGDSRMYVPKNGIRMTRD